MMLDGDHQREWREGEPRTSRVVFIGRNLPEEKIPQGFRELRGVGTSS
jgi:G3E family GTPase